MNLFLALFHRLLSIVLVLCDLHLSAFDHLNNLNQTIDLLFAESCKIWRFYRGLVLDEMQKSYNNSKRTFFCLETNRALRSFENQNMGQKANLLNSDSCLQNLSGICYLICRLFQLIVHN